MASGPLKSQPMKELNFYFRDLLDLLDLLYMDKHVPAMKPVVLLSRPRFRL